MSRRAGTVLSLSLLLLGGCGDGDGGGRNGAPTTLQVYAATSLRAAFTDLERTFEATHDVDVALTFGGSSALAAQIRQGAPAHVLATADEATMRLAVNDDDNDDDNALSPTTAIARNRLTIVVEPGNPQGITTLTDLADRDLVVVLCAPAVPCGRLAAAALRSAGVDVTARSLEENVGGVRSKVELGEADAGIVYVTDALDAGDRLSSVDDPHFEDPSLEAVYPMAVLDGAPGEAAAAWVAHVRSGVGRSALARAGFLAP